MIQSLDIKRLYFFFYSSDISKAAKAFLFRLTAVFILELVIMQSVLAVSYIYRLILNHFITINV